MSAVRLAAVVMWTELVNAMRADGLIAREVTSTGPATAALCMSWARDTLQPGQDGRWIPMHFMPASGRQVVAVDSIGGIAAPLVYDYDRECWLWNGSEVAAERFESWCYIKTPKEL